MLKKLTIICIFLLCFACSFAYARNIRVGLVQQQATVELSCDDEFWCRVELQKLLCLRENIFYT